MVLMRLAWGLGIGVGVMEGWRGGLRSSNLPDPDPSAIRYIACVFPVMILDDTGRWLSGGGGRGWKVEAVSSYVMAISCFEDNKRAGCIGSCIVPLTIVAIVVV